MCVTFVSLFKFDFFVAFFLFLFFFFVFFSFFSSPLYLVNVTYSIKIKQTRELISARNT